MVESDGDKTEVSRTGRRGGHQRKMTSGKHHGMDLEIITLEFKSEAC